MNKNQDYAITGAAMGNDISLSKDIPGVMKKYRIINSSGVSLMTFVEMAKAISRYEKISHMTLYRWETEAELPTDNERGWGPKLRRVAKKGAGTWCGDWAREMLEVCLFDLKD